MKLGENILKLRKQRGLSQEQLGEKVNVTRQTISNWELNETTPNIEQLKLLSKAFDISVDELLNNEVKSILEKKVSNTEKLAGMIIKILKLIGIALGIFLIIDIISIICFSAMKVTTKIETSAGIVCNIEDDQYEIEIGTNKSFLCYNCSDKMSLEIKEVVDWNHMDESMKNIEKYFESKGGNCN